MLLTAFVFFNTYVWLMAATISGNRLALARAFLVSIAAAFVTSAIRERVRPMLQSATVPRDEPEKLAGTPCAAMGDVSDWAPLKTSERVNVVVVLAVSQLAQIMVVAVVTTAIYLILGLIVLSPDLLNEWTHTYTSSATVLGFTLPVPHSLIHMTRRAGVHVHQRPRGRRPGVPLHLSRPSDRRPAGHIGGAQRLSRRRRAGHPSC